MSPINRTSSIRSGFDYQDFWGLRLLGQWLVGPDKYKWIQFETCPDDNDPSQFYLDDIVCLDSNNLYCFYQIKHRQDSTNAWMWDNFLVPKRSGGTSIIKKWTQSLLPRLDKTKEAFFITNGQAAEGVSNHISDEKLNIKKIKHEDSSLYNRIVAEIGSDQKLDQLFQILHFQFSQENLSQDELEINIRKYFYENLKATESGVTNLYHEIGKECRQHKTRQLDIQTLRKWCEFDMPRPLEEQFDIPSDFEFFDDRTHQAMLDDLQKSDGGAKVIFGKPGVGKSVYLSKLDEELKAKEIIVIKHHYHISPEDSNPQERLNAERVVEAIKSQFKSHREKLGDLANKNSKEIPLGEFITRIGTKLSQENKAFVIIVDGIDHVLRYGAKEELEAFLQGICLPQIGVWIIIGMQAIAKPHLPQIIFDKCPESQWVEIKGLSKNAVSNLIRANKIGLHLPDHAEQFKSLVEKLFSITNGNPLHLRYSLQQLKNLLGNSMVTEYSCRDLIPYGDGIEKYYESLWNQISDNAKTLLLSIASVNFLFTEEQLIECVAFSTAYPADITNAFNEISHLISKNLRRQMSVYHNSFELFLKDRPEMAQQKIAIKTNVKKWLEQSNYEYLKWAELRIIEHELGNSDPILEIDRHWLIDAICYPCNPDQIANQMKLAARVACEKEDFARGLQISYLYTYYLNSKDFVEEATELIWNDALHHTRRISDYIDIESLPTAVLPNLAEIADSQGNTLTVQETIEMLIERLSRQEYRQNLIPRVTAALLDTLPYDRSHNLNGIYKYIVQFRDLEVTDSLFKIYSRKLLSLGQKDKIAALLTLDLTIPEEQAVLVECAKYGLKNSTVDISAYIEGKQNLPLLCLLYQTLKNKSMNLPALPQYDIFPATIREHDSAERAKWRGLYYANFLIGLLYGLAGKQKDVEQWIANAPILWSAKAISGLFAASLQVASGIQQSKIIYTNLFNSWAGLEKLKWPEDRDSLSFQDAFSDAISAILEDIISLKEYLGDSQEITLADYQAITQNPSFFSKNDLTSMVLDANKTFLARDVYEKIREENIDGLSKAVNYLPDRAKDYSNISKLARLYSDTQLSESTLKKAADNLLGYGYHKDVYLFDVLEAIEFCAGAGTKERKINEWVARLIPLIDNVGDYTDGDETNHLPFSLADLLAEQNSDLLYKYYYWSANKEELYHAEDLFQYVIKSLPFTSDEQIALAATAVDKDSFSQLKAISCSNAGAAKAFSTIQSYLGEVNYPKEKGGSHPVIEKPVQDYSKVDPDHLLEHLSTNFENRWEWNNYLVGWLNHWLGKNDKEKIYNTLKQIVEKFGIPALSGELLDLLYPLAYEFDNGVAFDILCHAQENDHGWQRYWTDKKKAESRWKFIKEKYPQRYIEFFQKSTNYHVPLSRGVEFLLLFADLSRAEAITEASVQFAESLMADSILPAPEWLSNEDEITELDILIQRLLWPSPLVREGAANAIANLLYFSEHREEIFKKLLYWIQQQKMETAVAIGLLPIVKAFYSNTDWSNLVYVNFKDIVDSIPINSEVTKKLTDELALLTDKPRASLPDYQDIESCPADYSVNPFFSKYIKTFLAPIYLQRATEIERRSGRPFVKQWSFTADGIVKDTGIELNSNQVYYYGRSEHDEFLLGFSSKISEVYRSGFLRVLQHFYKNSDIQDDFYLEYAYATLPVELSKWKVLTNRAPEWWPKLEHAAADENKQQDSITPISFQNPPEELIRDREGKTLIAAEGAIQPAESWTSSDPSHSFLLIAFGYKVIGSEIPAAEEIADEIFYSPTLAVIPSKTDKPFNFLEDQSNHLAVRGDAIRIKDILIYPIVARERDLCIALWQYFRDYDRAFNLHRPLSQNLKLIIDNNVWHYQDSDGKNIVTYTDWLEGLKERYDRDMPLPHGQSLIIDSDYLNQWLKNSGLRLGYVMKTGYRTRKYSHDDIQKYEDIKLLKVSNIIV